MFRINDWRGIGEETGGAVGAVVVEGGGLTTAGSQLGA